MGLHYIRPAPLPHAPPDHFPDAPVEGAPPSPRTRRLEKPILIAASALGFVAAILVGQHIGGPRGAAFCLALFAFYFLLGWWPYFAAAHYRRTSHEDRD